ncbi:MAG: polyphosphate polymerase domain-containing protein [Lachnospiraceae bacterium]|nr:polyphosphate polymerase domain-containing protein [Lachnospiraceae bacterium]
MSYQDIFKRYEMKYMLTKEQKEIVLREMAQYMKPDEYGRSTICNIYFDTPDYQLIRHSLEKPVYKEKLRVRSYGPATEDGTVFVELKKKYKGVVYKRRISAKQKDAMDYLLNGAELPEQGQITDEISYFKQMYQGLRPAVYLSYDREAFYGIEDRELRITFDQNILWRKENLSLSSEVYGTPILEPGCALMEIKIASAMPMWLCRVLSENGIYKTSFSKYGRAYEMICEAEPMQEQVVSRVYDGQTAAVDVPKPRFGEHRGTRGRKQTQIA